MSDNNKGSSPELEGKGWVVKKVNQIKSTTQGLAINMNIQPQTVSPSRLYMVGKNQGKAAVIHYPTPRKIITGDEQEYTHTARKVELESDAVVDAIFFVKDPLNESGSLYWGSYYVVFRSLETEEFFLLEMPKFHNQNTELGFEFHYDKKLMRRLGVGARFSRGDVFGQSARISDQGEWCPGREARVATMSHTMCEEDAIGISESFARLMGVTFNRVLEHQWNEDDYIPLNLYGTKDDPQPFPLPGEEIRPDNIVMGFRPKNVKNALVTLTKKSLMEPDPLYDVLFYGKPGSVVADIHVETDRYKNQANNKRAHKRTQPHTRHLEMYESAQNRFYNDIVRWYESKKSGQPFGKRVAMDKALWNMVLYAYGQRTVDHINSSSQYVKVKRKFQNILLKDWRLVIHLKQDVSAKVRFKMTGMHGNKSTIGKIIPDAHMPVDDYGIRADIIAANFPDFRRQIFSSLLECDINFINIRIYKTIKELITSSQYKEAWDELFKFYDTVSPDYTRLIEMLDADGRMTHMQNLARDENEFSIYLKSDSETVGVEISKRIDEVYPHIQPTPVTYINEFNESVRTKNPIMISSAYYIMLDKFGDDISSQSTPKLNIFGLPTSLSKDERAKNFFRAHVNRNMGATEGRLSVNQVGAAATMRALVLGNSPEMLEVAVKRLMEAENPFMIERLVHPGEEKKNYSLMFIKSILGDFGLCLTREEKTV